MRKAVRARWIALVVLGQSLLSLEAAAETPLVIGSQKQLLIDDYVIEAMSPRVYRLMNQPLKYPENPVIRLDTDWEHKGGLSHGGDCGQIFFDPDRGIYRFYDLMVNWDWSRKWLSYAESKDGIHWIKPKLGQVEYLGYDTNFISVPFSKEAWSNTVFRDPATDREQERYKMIYFDKPDGKKGMFPAYSADGLNWKPYQVDQPAVPYWSDTNNNLMWDSKRQRYILYLRTGTSLNRWMDPEPIYPEGARTRTAGFATSTDFLNWDSPATYRNPDDRFICFHADEKDPVGSRDFYTLEVLPYEGGFVGFTSVYHNMFGVAPAGMDSGKARSPWMDRMNVQLLWSRDGEKFTRVGQGRQFIPNGPEGSWDQDLVYSVHNGIVREDRGEIWLYYEGFSGHHWFKQRREHQRGQVGLAILRLDGFASITGQGTLTTRPLTFEGSRLQINASGVDKYVGPGYGSVRVEVLDGKTGLPIPDFQKGNSDEFGEDAISHTVTWKGRSNLESLRGKTIKLKFHLDKAKLFSFQFVP